MDKKNLTKNQDKKIPIRYIFFPFIASIFLIFFFQLDIPM